VRNARRRPSAVCRPSLPSLFARFSPGAGHPAAGFELLTQGVLYLSLFGAGILLSMHCVGMCGGFVMLLSGATAGARRRPWRPQLWFHAGRVASYACLGALTGALGSLSAFFWRAGRGQALLLLVAGAALGALGLAILGLLRWNPLRATALVPMRWLHAGLRRVLRLPRAWIAAPYGALLGLLPCGLIYTMLIRAAATASPWRGAAVMASFGAGAIPALLLVALGAARFTPQLRERLFACSGVLMLALGAAAIWHGLQWLQWARG